MRFFPLLNYPSLLVSMSADCRQFNVTLLLWLTLFLPACRRGKYAYNFLFTIFAFSTSAANTQNCLVCRLFSTTPPPLCPQGERNRWRSRLHCVSMWFALQMLHIIKPQTTTNPRPHTNICIVSIYNRMTMKCQCQSIYHFVFDCLMSNGALVELWFDTLRSTWMCVRERTFAGGAHIQMKLFWLIIGKTNSNCLSKSSQSIGLYQP